MSDTSVDAAAVQRGAMADVARASGDQRRPRCMLAAPATRSGATTRWRPCLTNDSDTLRRPPTCRPLGIDAITREPVMATMFLANVGNSDLRFNVGSTDAPRFVTAGTHDRAAETPNDRPLSAWLKCDPGTRATSAAIAARLDGDAVTRADTLTRLRFPLLGPLLRHTLAAAGRIDRVVLFVTDQEDPAFRKDDSIDTGRVAERVLLEALGISHKVGALSVKTASNPPIEYGRALRFFAERCERTLGIGSADTVFAGTSGGVPAQNGALQQSVLTAFGPRATILVVVNPREPQSVRGVEGVVNVVDTWPLRVMEMHRVCTPLLEAQHECGAARSVIAPALTKTERERPDVEALLRFLAYAERRFNMDYSGAVYELRDTTLSLNHRDAMLDYWNAVRLHDLRDAAGICFDRQDYAGFLARASSIRELAWRHVVRVRTGFAIEHAGIEEDSWRQTPWLAKAFRTPKTPTRRHGVSVYVIMGGDYETLCDAAPGRSLTAAEQLHVHSTRDQLGDTRDFDHLRNEVLHEQKPASDRKIKKRLGDARTRLEATCTAVVPLANPRPDGLTSLRDLGAEALARVRALLDAGSVTVAP